jgi:hypothetical protein
MPGAVIADANDEPSGLGPGGDFEFCALGRSIDGVVDEVGPDLAEGGAARADGGGRGREALFDLNLLEAQLVAEDGERALQAVVDVEFLAGVRSS